MPELDTLLAYPPFSLSAGEKEKLLLPLFLELAERHRRACPPYGSMLSALGYDAGTCDKLSDLPFLPVGLFKRLVLSSVPEDVTKTVTSSGTTGQNVSKVMIDAETAALQRQALASIAADVLGPKRLPMLIVDTPDVLHPPLASTARGAGVLGFAVCASRRVFALRQDMSLDTDAIAQFLEERAGAPFFLFGFTFMVWKHFCEELLKLSFRFDCSSGIMIHGGGWKKLASESVSRQRFHEALFRACNLSRIYDYYGMAEQTGSIFLECEEGHFHCSSFSQVFVRRSEDFSLCAVGEEGILQVLSVLPRSYPGHSLLTEDRGLLLGEDDCPCGRKGRYFSVLGRLPNAELRGCSDVYGSAFG
ncbi:hypothetical protein SDC9_43991 [bioreactor metagenome]|uniref:Acyl-protein synthetase LuxE domain-containing protein n=1 Tax=bioreactor metagenome TaxID=1076179 RepID=A0A644W2P0_9ZZZZ